VRERLDVLIQYRQDGDEVFSARVWGKLEPLHSRSLTRAVTRQPLTPLLTLPRIWRQAAALCFGKRLPVFRRPPPADPLTVRCAPPGPVQRFAVGAVSSQLERIRSGRLTLDLPDGTRRSFGGADPGPDATLVVRDFRLFPRLLGAGDIGFGESYVDREWDCDDLTELLTLLLRNAVELGDHRFHTDRLGRAANFVRHRVRRNTLRQSRANIGAHYDLSNDFYRLFLDPSLTYSCAWYPRPEATLEEAQQHKLRRLLEKARLREGEHVLEIGCGWGSCALLAAQEFGCRVTGITLSREQLALARERVAEAGLEKRVELRLEDYRNVQGRFDKIVSIEMLEAVGHEYLGTFFAACDRLLGPEGLAVVQVITIPDQRYRSYRASSDWIRKHIFPGGHLPSLTAMTHAMTRSSALVVEHLENIGVHYARTLREWRERLESRRDQARALGFDDAFLRKWRYYFSYCEAGFRVRMLNDLQLVLTRPGNPGLPGPPYGSVEP
jgi:cyclopropane-fatty-acyl-phospholipid synthase